GFGDGGGGVCAMKTLFADAGSPKLKLILPEKLNTTVNRIIEHDEVLELSFERGMNLSQMEEIATSISDGDTAGVGIEVDKGLTIAQTGLIKQSMGGVQRGLDIIREARSVERKNENLRKELREHLKLSHLLVTGDHRMRLDAEVMVTGVELLEVLSFFQSLMFTLLKDRPTDRTWFMRKFREKYEVVGGDE
nr:hypothetical protein [Chlamydiota bacterium]